VRGTGRGAEPERFRLGRNRAVASGSAGGVVRTELPDHQPAGRDGRGPAGAPVASGGTHRVPTLKFFLGGSNDFHQIRQLVGASSRPGRSGDTGSATARRSSSGWMVFRNRISIWPPPVAGGERKAQPKRRQATALPTSASADSSKKCLAGCLTLSSPGLSRWCATRLRPARCARPATHGGHMRSGLRHVPVPYCPGPRPDCEPSRHGSPGCRSARPGRLRCGTPNGNPCR
jgi:hypothetical protein